MFPWIFTVVLTVVVIAASLYFGGLMIYSATKEMKYTHRYFDRILKMLFDLAYIALGSLLLIILLTVPKS